MGRYRGAIALAIFIKLIGTLSELLLPYILEHIIDFVVPSGDLRMVLIWGAAMFAAAVFCRAFNVYANRMAVDNAHRISYEIRQALFEKTIRLSGPRFDSFTLPSLISRMTSDSYNVQSAVQQLQSLCVRAPIMLVGGVIVSLLMDVQLALILVVMLPVLILLILLISSRGIPMYNEVQRRLDAVVRIMRENITGIRVVKALSREEHETERFRQANEETMRRDIRAGMIMSLPGPIVTLFLNVGLTLVVWIGARRVNDGVTEPGVILAFSDDYFGWRRDAKDIEGIVIREEQVYSDVTRTTRKFPPLDVMAALPDGSLRTYLPDEHTAQEYLDIGAQNTWAFGPILVRDGQPFDGVEVEAHNPRQPRQGMGMLAPNDYLFLTVLGRRKDSEGCSLQWLQSRFLGLGVSEAINLDGGNSAMLVFDGEMLNKVKNIKSGNLRGMVSMIAFTD